jgi:hypothetical protein
LSSEVGRIDESSCGDVREVVAADAPEVAIVGEVDLEASVDVDHGQHE